MLKSAWGAIAAKVAGLRDWRDHDGTKTWSDAGQAEKLFAEFLPKVQSVIAQNVKEGVADYAASGEYTLSVRDKTLWVDLRLWNDEATLVVGVPLRDIINKAVGEAYKAAGASPSAQEFLSHILSLSRDLSKMTAQMAGPQHQAQQQAPVNFPDPRQIQPQARRTVAQ